MPPRKEPEGEESLRKMTTYMQEEIDVDAIPRKTDVPVCTTMTRSTLMQIQIKTKSKAKDNS